MQYDIECFVKIEVPVVGCLIDFRLDFVRRLLLLVLPPLLFNLYGLDVCVFF